MGTLTRSVPDAWLLWNLMRLAGSAKVPRSGAPQPPARRKPKRLWRLRGLFEKDADAESLAAFEIACRRLAKAGAKIVERPLPPSFDGVLAAQERVMVSEAAAYHRENFAARSHLYPAKIAEGIRQGQATSAVDLALAYELRRRVLADLAPILANVDAAITPTTPTPAPTPETTGLRTFQAPWSFTGLPTITVPSGLASDGLPMGVQFVGAAHEEDALFAACAWAESKLEFEERPK